MKLLEQLCQIHAPSGSEYKLSEFLLKYIEENKSNWKNQPIIHQGEDFQDCIVLVFGKSRSSSSLNTVARSKDKRSSPFFLVTL